jgi:hypothetical protein
MNCPRCNTPTPEGKSYCADCGTPLNPTVTYLEEFVTKQVKESLDAKFKDQKLIEMEISLAVAERVIGWSKLFTYVVGIPLAVGLLGLSFAGIKKYEDFTSRIRGAEEQIKPRLEQAKTSAELAKQQADEALRIAGDAKNTIELQLKSAKGFNDKVTMLSAKVSKLEEQTSLRLKGQNESADKAVADLESKIDAATKDIAVQQKKLASTNELVKSLFSKTRTEYFDTNKASARAVVVPLGRGAAVFLLLTQIPIEQTVDVKFHVYSQPKDSYHVLRQNLVLFSWGDPADSIKQHPLEVNYIPDATDTTTPSIKALSVKDNKVYADDEVVMTFPSLAPPSK